MRSISVWIALIMAVSLYQEVTTTGNSEVNIQVESNVTESNGQVYRRVETNINGQRQVYESNEPGSFNLQITNGPSPEIKPKKPPVGPTKFPMPTPLPREELKSWIERWEQQLREWLQALPKKILPQESA